MQYILFVVLWQGSPQFVVLEFPSPVRPAELHVQFHGGFSGQSCHLEAESDDTGSTNIMKFYPQDSSSLQVAVVKYILPWGVSCCDVPYAERQGLCLKFSAFIL